MGKSVARNTGAFVPRPDTVTVIASLSSTCASPIKDCRQIILKNCSWRKSAMKGAFPQHCYPHYPRTEAMGPEYKGNQLPWWGKACMAMAGLVLCFQKLE